MIYNQSYIHMTAYLVFWLSFVTGTHPTILVCSVTEPTEFESRTDKWSNMSQHLFQQMCVFMWWMMIDMIYDYLWWLNDLMNDLLCAFVVLWSFRSQFGGEVGLQHGAEGSWRLDPGRFLRLDRMHIAQRPNGPWLWRSCRSCHRRPHQRGGLDIVLPTRLGRASTEISRQGSQESREYGLLWINSILRSIRSSRKSIWCWRYQLGLLPRLQLFKGESR